jgi:uncharacterized protein
MITNLWINLPVKNIAAALKFYMGIGFSVNENYTTTEESASLFIGTNNTVLMLFHNEIFKNTTEREIGEQKNVTNALFSIGSESIESVTTLSELVIKEGGTIIRSPGGDANMYGFSFFDLDNHSWNVLYMNENLAR